jgi:hypothetical protein
VGEAPEARPPFHRERRWLGYFDLELAILWVGPPGLVVYPARASNRSRSGEPGDLIQSCPCAAVYRDGCPPMKFPVCLSYPVGSQDLPVGATLSCASYLLPHTIPATPAYPTVVPDVRHTSTIRFCL